MDAVLVLITLIGLVLAALLLHADGVRIGREQALTEIERRRRWAERNNRI